MLGVVAHPLALGVPVEQAGTVEEVLEAAQRHPRFLRERRCRVLAADPLQLEGEDALDAKLKIPGGFTYHPQCEALRPAGTAGAVYCGGDFADVSYDGGTAGLGDSGAADSSGSAFGGEAGGGDAGGHGGGDSGGGGDGGSGGGCGGGGCGGGGD